ncbi:MAG: DUF3883 domain-containing protein [Patescibacteria group bacterium]
MINQFKDFLKLKTSGSFWKKAKQYEFSSIESIALALQNHRMFTTRNSISLRLLGFIDNLGDDNLELTEVGKKFLSSKNKQLIIDEQLLKIYLDSDINNRLNIPVYPLGIIFIIYTKLEYVTFKEYKLFICWINSISEVEVVIDFIKKYRTLDPKQVAEVEDISANKIRSLNVQDFSDNIYRLFKIFTLSSYLRVEGSRYEEVIYRNCKAEAYDKLVSSLKIIENNDYHETLTNYQGLIDEKNNYDFVTNPIRDLSNKDRLIIFKQINEKLALPEIGDIVPKIITPKMIKKVNKIGKTKSKKQNKKKIDYLARESRNQLVGLHAELVVFNYESKKLISNGRLDLSQQVAHESLTDDSLGYDLKSFELDGTEKHIEVKAVKGKPSTFSFYISKNELAKVEEDPSHRIYIVFDYESVNPEIWEMPHLLKNKDMVKIDAVKFQVTLTIER